ncbi:putative lysosomal cobalamin transporter [Mortierella sp. NVP85]|nr:putative lysosomal cobalamin transporter [Mortierella sp. NVP85]
MDSATTIPKLVQSAGAWGVFSLMGVDRDPFALLVTILALTLCLSTAALFPIDIFLVSRIVDPVTGLRYEWATDEVIAGMQLSVKIIYHVAYGLIVSFCFFWIPLSYFYFEELADEEQTMSQRLWTSFKYTIFFVLVACTLLLTGLLMKPNRHEGIDLDWLRKALTDLGAMAFVAGILALAGMAVLAFYAVSQDISGSVIITIDYIEALTISL